MANDWLDSLYPQQMAQMTPDLRQAMMNRAMLSMGGQMLAGAGNNQNTGVGLGSAMQTGIGTMDQMMNAVLQNKLRKDQFEHSKNVHKWREKEADRNRGVKLEHGNTNGVPWVKVLNNEGNMVDFKWAPNQWGFGGLGAGETPVDTTPADTTAPEASGPSWLGALGLGWNNMMEGLGAKMAPPYSKGFGAPPVASAAPPALPQNLMKFNQGQPTMSDFMSAFGGQGNIPAQSGLPDYFNKLPRAGQRLMMEQRKDRLTEDDKRLLTSMGLM